MTDYEVMLSGRAFLESPRWHSGALYVADIFAGEVLRLDGNAEASTIYSVSGEIMALGWDDNEGLLVAGYTDRQLYRVAGGSTTVLADLTGVARVGLHDMCVDGRGRAYVGTFEHDYQADEAFRPDLIVRVDPDGSHTVVADDLQSSNGMVVEPGNAGLIVAESVGMRILHFDLSAAGELSNKRVWADLGAIPDGICLDAEGALWVGLPLEDEFIRVREGGEVLDSRPVDSHAIACALGGIDGRTLYMITDSTLGKRDDALSARTSSVLASRVATPAA